MKIRNDFVTNSSSSSFIIAVKDVNYDFLLNTVLKDFYIATRNKWDDRTDEEIASGYHSDDVVNNNKSSMRLCIKSKSEIDEYDDWWHGGKVEHSKNNEEQYYVIDNNMCGRFDFDLINEIITEKHNIKWEYGYCD